VSQPASAQTAWRAGGRAQESRRRDRAAPARQFRRGVSLIVHGCGRVVEPRHYPKSARPRRWLAGVFRPDRRAVVSALVVSDPLPRRPGASCGCVSAAATAWNISVSW